MRGFSDCHYLKSVAYGVSLRFLLSRVGLQLTGLSARRPCRHPHPCGWSRWQPTSADGRITAPRLAEVGNDIVAGWAAMLHAVGSQPALRARTARERLESPCVSARATPARPHRDLEGQQRRLHCLVIGDLHKDLNPACRRQRLLWPTAWLERSAAPPGPARAAGLNFVKGGGPMAPPLERHRSSK
jgi:hypothetical protein